MKIKIICSSFVQQWSPKFKIGTLFMMECILHLISLHSRPLCPQILQVKCHRKSHHQYLHYIHHYSRLRSQAHFHRKHLLLTQLHRRQHRQLQGQHCFHQVHLLQDQLYLHRLHPHYLHQYHLLQDQLQLHQCHQVKDQVKDQV